MANSDDDDFEDLSPDLFDTSDVVFSVKETKRRNEITLVARAESDFSLIKYYLALQMYLEMIAKELDIMEQQDGEH